MKRIKLRLTLLLARTLFSALFFSLSTGILTASANMNSWDEMAKKFLIPLTYPDFNPEDFGRQTIERDKRLLEKNRPVIYISPGGNKPIDFYKSYLPETEVIFNSPTGIRVVRRSPDRKFLKGIERKKGYCLKFTGSFSDFKKSERVGYGQVIREIVNFRMGDGEVVEVPMIFLRYNFVFPKSGLPAKLPWYKEFGAWILGDPEKWHVLDIHGAIHVVLDVNENPVALILAQHNYHRTYLLNKEISVTENGRVKIGFAERSNEPYPAPRSKQPAYYPAADTPEKIAYILTGKNPSLKTGEDKVYGEFSGGVKVDYRLKFLPTRDPLYTSWIPLGDKLKIFFFFESWYRSGPPGMDLRTWPALEKYGELMQFWYVRNGDEESAEFMSKHIKNFLNVDFEKIIERNGKRLYKDLKSSSGYIHATTRPL